MIAIADPLVTRPIPAPDPLADFFWLSGEDGRLRVLRCTSCTYFIHPPTRPCPRCHATELTPAAVSGLATVVACTVNTQEWIPGQPPYAVAIVELVEQPGLRLTSNVVGCVPADVHIGQLVSVRFVHRNDLYYPVFTPTEGEQNQ